MTTRRRVLGIDPGLAATGYGVVDSLDGALYAVDFGVIRTKAKSSRGDRLAAIHDGIATLIEDHSPDEMAIEQQYVAANVRSAMAIGEARAAALIAAARRNVPVHEYQPSEVKQSVTGYGGAPKEQVQQMVALQLALDEPPQPADAADALAMAITRIAEARFDALVPGAR